MLPCELLHDTKIERWLRSLTDHSELHREVNEVKKADIFSRRLCERVFPFDLGLSQCARHDHVHDMRPFFCSGPRGSLMGWWNRRALTVIALALQNLHDLLYFACELEANRCALWSRR